MRPEDCLLHNFGRIWILKLQLNVIRAKNLLQVGLEMIKL